MKYLVFLSVLLFSFNAAAVNCGKVPDCGELGFTQEDNPECAEDGYIYCPFDTSYKKCVSYNCEALGFTQSDKTVWCDQIAECHRDKNYTACLEPKLEQKMQCQVGYVFYSDGTCGDVADYTAGSGKTPVGVVYYVEDDGAHGKVINLHDLTLNSSTYTFNPENPYGGSPQYVFWGLYLTDTPLKNYDSDSVLLPDLKAKEQEVFDGRYNTSIIANTAPTYSNCTNGTYRQGTKNYAEYCVPTAAKAALAFYPPEVNKNDPIVGQGQWYLPAIGELMEVYGYNIDNVTSESGTSGMTGTNKNIINTTLTTLKSKGVRNAEALRNSYYRSSSEYGTRLSLALYMFYGDRGGRGKLSEDYVRVSLAF